jgi:hypothetical protein
VNHNTALDAAGCRSAVWWRQGGLCALCWQHLGQLEDGWEAHHRLRVALMPKDARWCPCDVVALHARCHTQGPAAVHDHPDAARDAGLILSYSQEPALVPIVVEYPWVGLGYLDCEAFVVSPDAMPAGVAEGVQQGLPFKP